jgi:hypothetical protein
MVTVSQISAQDHGIMLRPGLSFSALGWATKRVLPAYCVSALILSSAANATLGQAAPLASLTISASATGVKAQAASPRTGNGLYTRHERQLESGTVVQEFATLEGVVFAVAWRGPVLPDLSALLGEHFDRFKRETEQARRLGKRGSPVNLVSDKLMVSSGGRMRGFYGHAYVPALIPEGLSIRDVLR